MDLLLRGWKERIGCLSCYNKQATFGSMHPLQPVANCLVSPVCRLLTGRSVVMADRFKKQLKESFTWLLAESFCTQRRFPQV